MQLAGAMNKVDDIECPWPGNGDGRHEDVVSIVAFKEKDHIHEMHDDKAKREPTHAKPGAVLLQRWDSPGDDTCYTNQGLHGRGGVAVKHVPLVVDVLHRVFIISAPLRKTRGAHA